MNPESTSENDEVSPAAPEQPSWRRAEVVLRAAAGGKSKIADRLHTWWVTNSVHACNLLAEGEAAGNVSAEYGVKRFVRTLATNELDASISYVATLRHATRYALRDLHVFHAVLSHHGSSFIVACEKYGTCWYCSFIPDESIGSIIEG